MSSVKPVPEGFHTITPYLVVKDAGKAIEFYSRAFGSKEVHRHLCEQTGKIMNAQIRIGNSMLMLNDEMPDFGCLGPVEGQKVPVTLHLYVSDVDAFFENAVSAGATPTMPVSDTFWGDRYGQLADPFGYQWSVATRKEDLSNDEIMERARRVFPSGAPDPSAS